MMCKSLVPRLLGLLALVLVSQQAAAGPVTVFSESPLYRTPETISPAPAGFGSFGGQYFIPDFNRGQPNGNLWVVPSGGGAPSSFATIPVINARGGLFLPETGWGANSGHFLVAGPVVGNLGETGLSRMYTFGPDGSPSLFLETAASFSQARIAPDGFGSLGGQLVVASPGASVGLPNSILTVSSTGVVGTLATTSIGPFGLAFAPPGFGSFGGQLFVSSSSDGQVQVVSADGSVQPFANIPLISGQSSLFQMEFSPSGFLPGYGELLFVSVRGSINGGGTLGDVVALDSNGQIVARLRTDLGLEKFDPRGLYFLDNQGLLVSDASDPILLITPAALQAVPEPSTFVLSGLGLAVAGLIGLRKKVSG